MTWTDDLTVVQQGQKLITDQITVVLTKLTDLKTQRDGLTTQITTLESQVASLNAALAAAPPVDTSVLVAIGTDLSQQADALATAIAALG